MYVCMYVYKSVRYVRNDDDDVVTILSLSLSLSLYMKQFIDHTYKKRYKPSLSFSPL